MTLAALAGAIDPATGEIFIFWEYHEGRRSIKQHVEQFMELSRGSAPGYKYKSERGPLIKWAYGGSHQEDEIRQAYNPPNAGWTILEPNIHNVDAGIAHAYSFIAKNQIKVFKTCHRFIDQLLTYSYDLKEDYEPSDRIINKSDFHLLDAFRYMASGFDRERTAQSNHAQMLKTYSQRDQRGYNIPSGRLIRGRR
jgi:hypothetical protein